MKVLVAMSGGVDSSVAALLLKQQGYDCTGCTMKLYDNEDAGISRSHPCCTLDDIEDARRVAYGLDMRYFVFNFKDRFREKVIKKFIDSYLCGRTPNPCIDCNRYLKFEKLFERAEILECNYVATGHYARIEFDGERYLLKKAADESKDQSYVLYSMTQYQLAHTLFPLGCLAKSDVRKIAEENGFANAAKPDSQDICFVPDKDYAGTIERLTGVKSAEGNFLNENNEIIGTHKGIIHYTIGQRRGLQIPSDSPLYVCRIDARSNTVTLGHSESLFSSETDVADFNWISGEAPESSFRCKVKIRYRHREEPATVYPEENGNVHIVFDSPQRAITPGQAAVLYDGDTVLGGGIIIQELPFTM